MLEDRLWYSRNQLNSSSQEYQNLKKQQNDVCAICYRPETRISKGCPCDLSIDHCHGTGRIRGLLCNECNTALGMFRDDVTVMGRAIEYVQRQKIVV